ncbi:MAG TPA: Ger(x)C family spore germination protein [Verrucomicrobiae bacterium]|nr:Ger(x)C family spore germination protein [Verrucomicrobiae bacterium]
MANSVKQLTAILLIILILFTTACWSKSEIDELAFIMVIAIDRAEDGNYLVSFKIAKPRAQIKGGDKDGGSQGKQFLVFGFKVANISEAAVSLYKALDKAPFFGQTRDVIISEEVAKQGINPILDHLSRFYRLRRNILLFIAKGKALDVIETKISGTPVPGLNFAARIDNSNENNLTEEITVGNFLSKLAADKIQPIVPGIRRVSNRDPEIAIMETEEIAIDKIAVFKGDRLLGWLNDDETRGYMLTTNKGSRSWITVPFETDSQFVYLLKQTKMSKKIEMENGLPTIKLKFTADAVLMEVNEPVGHEHTPSNWPANMPEMEALASEKVRSDINQAVAKAQEFNSDIFGFGQLVYREKPEVWRGLESHWNEEIFPNLRVSVDAEIKVKRSGSTVSPPYTPKEERNLPVVE